MGIGSAARAIAGAIVALALAAPASAQAQIPQLITGPYVSGWFGYWEPDADVERLATQGGGVVPEASIFWAKFSSSDRPLCAYEQSGACLADGASPWISPAIDRQRQAMQDAGIRVFGSIIDAGSARSLSTYLSTKADRSAYAAQIVEWTAKAGFDGVDLDWEKFAFADGKDSWAATKPRWVAFIRVLAHRLHDRGLLLSATVPAGSYPFLANGDPNPGTGYWVYAWNEISDHVDRLRIMAYDYSYATPGPIGPYPWAKKVTESAIQQVTAANKRKLWLGVPQYSRNWVRQDANGSYVTRNGCPQGWKPSGGGVPGMLSQSLDRALEIAAREGIVPTWNGTYGEYTFTYWIDTAGTVEGTPVTCSAEREVWFEDTRGAKMKADIVSDLNIGGLAVWEFGFVLDGFYSDMAREIAPPLQLRASFDSTIRLGQSARVSGKVTRDSSAVTDARIRVTWISSAGKVKELGVTRTSALGRYSLAVTPPRSGTLRVTARSEGQHASVSKPITVRR